MNACVQCGKPKGLAEPEKSDSDGARIPIEIWRRYVAADPYCSRECCEAAHGLTEPRETRECPVCGKAFEVDPRYPRKAYCSKKCQKLRANGRRWRDRPDRANRLHPDDRKPGHCVGCGIPHAQYTTGCYPCWQRQYRRKHLQDPEVRALDNKKCAERARRARERKRAEREDIAA